MILSTFSGAIHIFLDKMDIPIHIFFGQNAYNLLSVSTKWVLYLRIVFDVEKNREYGNESPFMLLTQFTLLFSAFVTFSEPICIYYY